MATLDNLRRFTVEEQLAIRQQQLEGERSNALAWRAALAAYTDEMLLAGNGKRAASKLAHSLQKLELLRDDIRSLQSRVRMAARAATV